MLVILPFLSTSPFVPLTLDPTNPVINVPFWPGPINRTLRLDQGASSCPNASFVRGGGASPKGPDRPTSETSHWGTFVSFLSPMGGFDLGCLGPVHYQIGTLSGIPLHAPDRFPHVPCFLGQIQAHLVSSAISHLLSIRAIQWYPFANGVRDFILIIHREEILGGMEGQSIS